MRESDFLTDDQKKDYDENLIQLNNNLEFDNLDADNINAIGNEQIGNSEMGNNPSGNDYSLGNLGPIMPQSTENIVNDNVENGIEENEELLNESQSTNVIRRGRRQRIGSAEGQRKADIKAIQDIDIGMREADNAMKEVRGWNFTPSIPKRSKPSLWRRFWTSFANGATRVAKAVTNVVTAPVVLLRYNYALRKLRNAAGEMQKKKNIDLIPGWEGATFEKKLNDKGEEDGWDMLGDMRRVPVVWAHTTAEKAVENGKLIDPEISVLVDQPKPGSSKSFDFLDMGHTMIGIHYSRMSKAANRVNRYLIQYGFYPAGGTATKSMLALKGNENAIFPGQLMDDYDHSYSIGRRYKATEEQVGRILKASETYASGGYGYYKRNCTTFVRDMVEKEAGLNTGGILFENEQIRFNAIMNMGRMVGGFMGSFATANVYSQLADMSKNTDNSYQGYGNKRVNVQDVKNYLDSRNESGDEHVGFLPGVTGENLRRLEYNEETGGMLSSMIYFGTMGTRENLKVNFQDISVNVPASAGDMTAAMRSILPPGRIPSELSAFLNRGSYEKVYNGLLDALSKIRTFLSDDSVKEMIGDIDKQLYPYGSLSADELQSLRITFSDAVKNVNRIYQVYFKGDLRINKEVMNYLSILQAGINYIDMLYEKTETGEKVGRGRYINSIDQLYQNDLDITAGGLTARMSPSMYEAYLQVYKNPADAVKNYLEYKRLEEIGKDDRTSSEQKLFAPLKRKHELAKDFYMSHRYMLEKENFGQQDIEYIYKLSELERNGATLDTGDARFTGTASGVYKTLLFKDIFYDIQTEWDKAENDGGRPISVIMKGNPTIVTESKQEACKTWIINYMSSRIPERQDKLEMIIKVMKKKKPDSRKEDIMSEFIMDLYSSIIDTLMPSPGENPDAEKNAVGILSDVFGQMSVFPGQPIYNMFINVIAKAVAQ